ncbi:hypothetical protein GIB67_004556 [Kingdonia uniflora]|uniref:Aminotransferase class V domain-containing protein n=1 Tax=Kingdonia uniflora TaxID=39325 RepID=A0A7J7ML65_9MAGN|nr:hypothetical protein GIB67_004556 [Kingdonia uniflora]
MSGSVVLFTDQESARGLPPKGKMVKKGRPKTSSYGRKDEDGDLFGNEEEQRSNEDDFNFRAVSFKLSRDGFVDEDESAEDKCSWLRSQLVGDNVYFDTPFGKRHLTYADHTASGRSLHLIENFIIENVLPFYGNTHTDDSFVGHQTTKMVHEATKYIKRCMGGGPEDALLFCGSGTTAAIKRLQEVMGMTIPSIIRAKVIHELNPKERWVVFVGPYEHHSNLLSWRQSLAEIIEIGVDNEGLVDMDMLRRELRSQKYSDRPMLGSFSACSNVTGIYTDTRALARVLHEHGAFACFDFAASGPYVQFDLRSGELEGYDAVFLSPHKFIGGPGTPGILLMSKTLYYLRSAAPSTCGGGTVSFVNGFSESDTLYTEDIEEREDAGTPAIVQKIRAALAFWVKEYMGYQLIHTQENLWTEKALKRLLPNPNINILGNTLVKRQPILSFLIDTTSLDTGSDSGDRVSCMWRERATKKDKPLHGRFVTKLLNDLFGIQARGGCACAGPYGHILLNIDKEQSLAFRSAIQKGYNGLKPGWTRISFIYYMSITEFEFILAAIEFLIFYGQRFLPLYHFNWKTGDWTFQKSVLKSYVGDKHTLALASLKLGNGNNSDSNQILPAQTNINGENMEYKYTMYLETARYVARSLPKFPPQRCVPEEIDEDLIPFRI